MPMLSGNQITVDDLEAVEESEIARFHVRLNGPAPTAVTVHYQTMDGTATAGSDYVASSGTAFFAPGEIDAIVEVRIVDEFECESSPFEQFSLVLSDPQGASILDGTGVATITEDTAIDCFEEPPPPPVVSILDAWTREEDGSFYFYIASTDPGRFDPLLVSWRTEDGTATAGEDYVASSGTAWIQFCCYVGEIVVQLIDDEECETSQSQQLETMRVRLTGVTRGRIDDSIGVATIEDSVDCRAVPTILALFRAEPVAEGIAVRWQYGPGSDAVVTRLERSTAPEGPWVEVNAPHREEDGVAMALDRTVESRRTYWYRVIVRSTTGETTVFGPLQATAHAVGDFALAPPWPNPASGLTHIEYVVPQPAPMQLSVLDVQGREVALLREGPSPAGRFQATWNRQSGGTRVPGGIYFVRLQAGQRVQVRRLILLD